MLSKVSGQGTTLVTLLIPGGSQISLTAQRVNNELATADRIKSKDTRHAVGAALRSIKVKLASFGHHAPDHGIAIFASDSNLTCFSDLPARLKSPVYRCDSRFHIEPVLEMLNDSPTFAFIVFDGSGCLIASVSGTTIAHLGDLTAHLPKKHGKGGQSAPRFQHTRLEQRMLFRKKAEELCKQVLIGHDCKPICKAIVIAGSSNFKTELQLDCRLAPLVAATVTVQYSGANGLHEAIGKSRHVLGSLELFQEVDLLSSFFGRIATGGNFAFGCKSIAQAIQGSAIETLILSEEASDMVVCTMPDESLIVCKPTDQRVLSAAMTLPILDMRTFPIRVVSANSKEGAQFAGFQIGALLRYKVVEEEEAQEEEEGHESDDEFV